MSDPVLQTMHLGSRWPTLDPFLFCVHHDDAYPAGDEQLGPAASLEGRQIGQDFEGIDGWRMYHGHVVPGFPAHPHRGFETITYARRGLIDHSDSLGAAGRFGRGDVQWMTAGGGIVHSEMFPLLDRDGPNHTELFQIWLNLPPENKLVQPHFKMLWGHDIPRIVSTDDEGRTTQITVIAGDLAGRTPPAPPPDSWAAGPESDVAVWHLDFEAGARHELPSAASDTNRTLYVFEGEGLSVGGTEVGGRTGVVVRPDVALSLIAGSDVEVLVLQGRPIGAPVAQYGPFVMNTRAEIEQAVSDYQRSGFGGWPWPADDPVHGPERGRFARHADGRVEEIGRPTDT